MPRASLAGVSSLATMLRVRSRTSAATLGILAAVVAILIQQSTGTHLNSARWKRQSPCRRNQFQCNSGRCIEVFHLCDGQFHCDDRSDETATLCQRKKCPTQAFKCGYGACIDKVGVCNGVAECADGSDEERCASNLPETIQGSFFASRPAVASGSVERCPALVIPSRDIDCKLNDRKVDCTEPVSPGTTARVECKSFYDHPEEAFFDTICQFDGKWSRVVSPCQPKCGQPNPEGVPFIAGGSKAKIGEFPWHAGVYRFKDGNYEQICGGNIISERVIVSAGHCFWNDVTSNISDIKDYRIAVGKYYRDWDDPKDLVHRQTPEIEKVVVPRRFRGNRRNWQNDIAVITLKEPIRMSIAVRPICIDLHNKFGDEFVPGKGGIVVGWGVTETLKPGEILYKANMPYISFEDCEKEVPRHFLVFLTNDKFCGGFQNGTSICPGDGGGGFAAEWNKKWYLMGVASVGVPATNGGACNINQYATFTMVSHYYSFIEENLPK